MKNIEERMLEAIISESVAAAIANLGEEITINDSIYLQEILSILAWIDGIRI